MTENEQKEQLSVAYVHAVAARAGFTCQPQTVDIDSVDVIVAASGMVHSTSMVRSPRLALQLKASSSIELGQTHVAFPLPVKNYNDLRAESLVPTLLVVLMLPRDPSQWLETAEEGMISRRWAYWVSLLGMPETPNSTTVTINLPRSQKFTVDQLQDLMERVSRRAPL